MNILCITNRELSEWPFLEQMKNITALHPWAIILREKDLSFEAYKELSLAVLDITFESKVPLLLHGLDTTEPEKIIEFILKNNASSEKTFAGIHLSMSDFQKISKTGTCTSLENTSCRKVSSHTKANDYSNVVSVILDKDRFRNDMILGVSAHSLNDAAFCEQHGASYITASHIFPTDCKKGLPPKGIPFLREICDNTNIPVFALGGINHENAAECIESGAFGVSVMSECMKKDFNIF